MKISFYLIFFILLIILLFACNKETVKPNYDGIPNGSFINKALYGELITGMDEKDEAINKQLYALSEKMLQYGKNEEFYRFVNETAKKNDGTVTFEQIYQRFPETKSVLTWKGNLTGIANRDAGDCNIEYHNYIYKPVIYIPNLEAASASQPPMMSPGLEVESTIQCDTCPDLDEIFAWYLNSNNDTVGINIGEVAAKSQNRPIWVTSLEVCTYAPIEDGLKKPPVDFVNAVPEKNVSGRTTTRYCSNEYKIHARYDSSPHSEFCITGWRVTLGSSIVSKIFENPGDGVGTEWIKIADVHKSKINKDLSRWSRLVNSYPYSTNSVYAQTFERDWNQGPKSLGTGGYFGTFCHLKGARKYQDEYYGQYPGSDPEHKMELDEVFINTLNQTWTSLAYGHGGSYLRYWKVVD